MTLTKKQSDHLVQALQQEFPASFAAAESVPAKSGGWAVSVPAPDGISLSDKMAAAFFARKVIDQHRSLDLETELVFYPALAL